MGNPTLNTTEETLQNSDLERAITARAVLEDIFENPLPSLLSLSNSGSHRITMSEEELLEATDQIQDLVTRLESRVFPTFRSLVQSHSNLIESQLLDILLLRIGRLIVSPPPLPREGNHSISLSTLTLFRLAGAQQAITEARSIVEQWQSQRGESQRSARVSRLLETVREQRSRVRSMVYEFLVSRDGLRPRMMDQMRNVNVREEPPVRGWLTENGEVGFGPCTITMHGFIQNKILPI